MSYLLHRAPSVGSVTKRIITLYPDLSGNEVIEIIKKSMHNLGQRAGEFSAAETIDEAQALALARLACAQENKERVR